MIDIPLKWEVSLLQKNNSYTKKDGKNPVPTFFIESLPSFCDFPCQNCVMLSDGETS